MLSQLRARWANLPSTHLLKDPRFAVVILVIIVAVGGGAVVSQFAAGKGALPWLGLAALAVIIGFLGLRFVRVKFGVSGPPPSGHVLERSSD